jgi:hypothetical protein
MKLFVGRDEEVQLVGSQIVGSSSSRAIIEGHSGVGKTSFTNRVKSVLRDLPDPVVLTHAAPVRVKRGMSPRQFLAEVLKVLLQIRATEAAAADGAYEKVKGFFRRETALTEEDRFWRRIGRLIQGEDATAAGFTAGLVGAQREPVRIAAEIDDISLHDEVTTALRQLAGPDGRRKVLIHVNNMENLTREAAADAADLMQDVRDCFLADHGHWLFVGTTGIEHDVFRARPQVSGIIPFSVRLGPLTPTQVESLITRRYEHFALPTSSVPPVAAADAATLYERYHGQLRQFLSLLSNAVQRHAAHSPGQPLTVADVVNTMATLKFEQGLVPAANRADAEYLRATLAGKPHTSEFRVKELQVANQPMTNGAASKVTQRLVEAGVVRESRRSGPSVYYQVAQGDYSIALGMT